MEKLIHKDPVTGELSCNARDFDKFFPLLHAYEETGLTPEEIEQTMLRFSSFLMEMTGGRMSKTNYTVQAMVAEANDHFESICDECSDRQQLAEIKNKMETANEAKMMFASDEENQHDKEIFVRNLGWLLSQTREQVERCYLDEEEQVHVVFRGGSERTVNVKHDSYAAIIRDVSKALYRMRTMGDAESKSIRDIVKDIQGIAEKIKAPRIGPLSLCVPDAYAKYAANLYADQNVIIHTNNGSIYQYGVQIKKPGIHLDVRRLNEKIAAMDLPTYDKRLPTYIKRLQAFPPELRKVYLLGEWITTEEGEDHAEQ